MKFWKSLIRVWFTLASLASFLVGWAVLAHAPKPNQFNPSNVPAMPRLDPVPTLNQVMLSDQSQSFFQSSQRSNQQVMVLRSGGS
jgi:hypothetical protein